MHTQIKSKQIKLHVFQKISNASSENQKQLCIQHVFAMAAGLKCYRLVRHRSATYMKFIDI